MLPSRQDIKNCREKMTVAETAAYFNVSVSTIEKWLKHYDLSHHECKYGNKLPESLTDEQIEILNGSLLGDGCITGLSRLGRMTNGYFTLKQSAKIKEYTEYIRLSLFPFSCSMKCGKTRKPTKIDGKINHDIIHWKGQWSEHCKFNTASHKAFTNIANQWYVKGIKRIPVNLSLTWKIVSLWMCDDGMHRPNKRELVLCTNGFFEEDVDLLVSKLFELHVSCSKTKHTSGWQIRILSKSYDLFLDQISKYIIWDCMKYKCSR
jgi:transposase